MSRPLKLAQSGLGVARRGWSIPSASREPRSSQSIYDWSLTPPDPAARKLTGSEQGLKDIQGALSGYAPVPPSRFTSQVQNNRASPSGKTPPAIPARQFPTDWHSRPSLTRQPVGATNKETIYETSTSSSSVEKIASVSLSQEQTQILKLVQNGNSIFFTGSAGTGKSILLREIIKTLKRKYTQDVIAITASTGIAACNIGGITIHSFAGIGLGIESAENLAKKIKVRDRKAFNRWARIKVLIIDEVSMIDGELFDKLAQIARIIRRRSEPFGGIQVIITGDFFQLPPVVKGSDQVKFAFEAQLWKETVKHTYRLTKVFRQRDQTFIDMLNEMRFGTLSSESIENFKRLSRSIENGGLAPTELFPRREDVERSNLARLNQLTTEQETFQSIDGGAIEDMALREKMLSNFMASQTLTLRLGAQVMLIKNVDEMLVNGSMGKVLRFIDPSTLDEREIAAAGDRDAVKNASYLFGKRYPVVEFDLPNGMKRRMLVMPETWKTELPSGEIQVSRTQVPLILSWAISIHKSQGQTLERVKVDLGKVFEKGQVYVALSRATTLEGLQVLNFDATKVQAHPKVVEWSKTLSTIPDL